MNDPESDLDPLLLLLFREAGVAQGDEPDATALAEHLVGALLGAPLSRERRVQAAGVEAALGQRAEHRRRLGVMHRRLAAKVARAEPPAEAFARLTGRPPPG